MFNKGIYRPPLTGGSGGILDGDRKVKNIPVVGTNYGCATTSEWIENAFFPFIQALISLNSGTTYYEIGTTQSITLSGNVTAKDETAFSNAVISLSDGSDDIPFTAQAGAFSLVDADVVANVDYTAKIQGAGEGAAYTSESLVKSVRFIYAAFSGKNTTGALPTEAEIKAGLKSVYPKTSYYTVNPNTSGSEYGWFAVPHDQTANTYTTWFVVVGNDGAIGAGQFIAAPQNVAVDGINYDVYIYNYPSELNANLKIS